MREIEFRAKVAGADRWIYGLPHKVYEQNKIDSIQEFNCNVEYIAVDTLGQYTQLKDKNGVKIYEGDILEMTNVGWKYTLVKFHLGIFAFYTEETSFLYPMVRCYWEEGKVVGNIHENPEILEQIKNKEQ